MKILTIGNSFSDDTMQYVYDIAKSAGVKNIKLGNLYYGGCSLDQHANYTKNETGAYIYRTNISGTWYNTDNYKLKDALLDEDWDFISFQQASDSSGIPSTYSNLDYMINYVKERAPKSTLIWNMTWAYQQDSTHDSFPDYGSDQLTMYQDILSTVKSVVKTKKSISIIVPNGTAIQNARTSYVGDHLTRDGYHLTEDLGRYIAGLTFFHAITGLPIDDLKFAPTNVDVNKKMVAIESAINAVKLPDDITESQYTQAPQTPQIDESLYDKLEINWTMSSYWNTDNVANRNTLCVDESDFGKRFCASQVLSKQDIPVGSIIVVAEGWQYRPEGWEYSVDRPKNVTLSQVEITEEWWGNYTTRAFNLSKTDGSTQIHNLTPSELAEVFIIYVPKN